MGTVKTASDLAFRRYLPVETNLARKGLYATGRGRSSPTQIATSDLLGEVSASPSLRVIDLEVISWLGRRLEVGRRRVEFSLYELCVEVLGTSPAGGRNRVIVRESLERLALANLSLGGLVCIDSPEPPNKPAATSWASKHLLEDLQLPTARSGTEASTAAARHGPTCSAVLPDWLIHQLAKGYLTFMDWELMRSLSGLAKRLWIYLQAERYQMERDDWTGSLDFNRERTTLPIGPKLAAALGISAKVPARLRAQLTSAFAQIAEVDPAFEAASTRPTRRGSWVMVVTKRRVAENELRARLFSMARASGLQIGSTRQRVPELQRPFRQDLGPLPGVAEDSLTAYSLVAVGPLRFYPLRRGGMAGELDGLRQEFGLSRLRREYESYRAWVRHNPKGVVLRLHGGGASFHDSMLHRVSCPVIQREPGSRIGTRSDSRICSNDLIALLDWWAEEAGTSVLTCKRCSVADPWTLMHPAFRDPHNPAQEAMQV